MSFGRKGLPPQADLSAAGQSRDRLMRVPDEPRSRADISPQLAAFLAAERARKPEAPAVEPPASRPRTTGTRADALSPLRAQLVYPRDPRIPTQRSLGLAYLLWLFFSHWGGHRHYLGARTSGSAMAMLAWSGLLLIFFGRFDVGIPIVALFLLWTVVDLFLIPGLARQANNPAPLAG